MKCLAPRQGPDIHTDFFLSDCCRFLEILLLEKDLNFDRRSLYVDDINWASFKGGNLKLLSCAQV